MGPYCCYCDQRCFVVRVINGRSVLLATCPRGMAHDRAATGEDYTSTMPPRPAADLDAAYAAATAALDRFATGPSGDLACIGPSRAAALAVDAALGPASNPLPNGAKDVYKRRTRISPRRARAMYEAERLRAQLEDLRAENERRERELNQPCRFCAGAAK